VIPNFLLDEYMKNDADRAIAPMG